MDSEIIDSNILVIATGLGQGISEKEIVQVYTTAGFKSDDIFLLMMAAKLLHGDRVAVPKPRNIFRRVE